MKSLVIFIAGVAAAGALNAQSERRASYTPGGNASQGRCTVEVVVDGSADVTVRGDRGYIRTLSGNPASWRRFECTGPLPSNPADFRFQGVDGRGRQQLIQDPRSSGLATVRIDDTKGGSEGYTFQLQWSGGQSAGNYPYGGSYPYGDDVYGRQRDRSQGGAYGFDPVVRACGDAVRAEAARRFRVDSRSMDLQDVRVNAAPGRRGAVTGRVDFGRGRDRYDFECSVDDGRVRSVRINQARDDWYRNEDERDRYSDRYSMDRAVGQCQESVADRIRRSGYSDVDFGSVRAARENAIRGNARGRRGGSSDNFEFSCSVSNDRITSVDVRRR